MKVNGLRWWILSLIVLVTIINYLDRNTLAIMWQGIVGDLGLIPKNLSPEEYSQKSKELYSYIYMFFMVAYGISQMLSGKLYDKIGTRKGFVVSVTLWAIADACTSFARGLGSLGFFRVLLGLGEAGPWPGATKSNAEWFPQKERGFIWRRSINRSNFFTNYHCVALRCFWMETDFCGGWCIRIALACSVADYQ